MSRHLALPAGLGGLLLAAPGASAEFTGLSVQTKPNEDGINVCNVYAEFDDPGDRMLIAYGDDNAGVFAHMSVIGGTFFQSEFGADTPPNPLFFEILPTARHDTFVTIGVRSFNPADPGVPEGQPEDNLVLSAGWPGFEASTINLTDGLGGGAGWFVLPDDAQADPFNPDFVAGDGRVLIAQLSTVDGEGFEGLLGLGYLSGGVEHFTTATFTHLVGCPWDLDGSGAVGINDLLALLVLWGTDPGGAPDFDGDGNVGVTDLVALLSNWGPCA